MNVGSLDFSALGVILFFLALKAVIGDRQPEVRKKEPDAKGKIRRWRHRKA